MFPVEVATPALERWVATEYGRAGLRRLATLAPSTSAYLADNGGIDGAQQAFTRA